MMALTVGLIGVAVLILGVVTAFHMFWHRQRGDW